MRSISYRLAFQSVSVSQEIQPMEAHSLTPYTPQGKKGNFTISGHETPRNRHMEKKKNSQEKHGFNVGFQPYADHDIYLASVMVGVCTGKVEEGPEFRGGKEPPQACSVYRRTDTDIVPICLRSPRLVVCCRRSKLLTNKLPDGDDGIHCFIGRPKAFGFPPQPASSRRHSH